jgi:glycosyltransferase involved in cell wall biosynthesis
MQKKKVLILITKSNWGGAQRYVFDIATGLSKEEYDVSVMAGGNGELITRLNDRGIDANGSLPIGRDISLIGDIKAFFKLVGILRKDRPDILHINSSKIGGLGALAGRLARVPRIIFTSHGWAFNEDRSLVSKLVIKLIHIVTILLTHRTIVVSKSLKDQIDIWPTIGNKITVVHNAVKIEPIFSKVNAEQELKKVSPLLKERLETLDPKKTIVIGSVGELHHVKGHEYAIRGIAELIKSPKVIESKMNILYLIIGGGEEKDSLEKLIKELGVGNSVIMLGNIKDVYLYLKSIDIFLLPSISESFGYVLLEAGVASLPVIATAVGGIPEIIDDMKSGILIQAKKPSEIRNAIDFYLTHKKVRKEHGDELHRKSLTDFSIEKMIKDTLDVYTSAL